MTMKWLPKKIRGINEQILGKGVGKVRNIKYRKSNLECNQSISYSVTKIM